LFPDKLLDSFLPNQTGGRIHWLEGPVLPNDRSPDRHLLMNWYYAEGDQQKGPITEEELVSLAQSGRVRDDTLVWHEGMADWQPFQAVRGGLASESGQAVPPAFGGTEPAQDRPIHREAADFAELAGQGGVIMAYAGFWIRFVALLLDAILLIVLSLGIELVLAVTMMAAPAEVIQAASSFFQLVLGAAYVTFFLGKYGATPGKMALNLRVVRSDGSPITYARALGRYFAEYLSALTLLIGYIIAAFDVQKRTLHDHICDTRVIRD
jgi:uncharacterized RDD family membrane protein YckC